MLRDILSKPGGREVLQAVLECHESAVAQEKAKKDEYRRRYPGEEWWKSVRHGFRWTDPARLLVERGIHASPHGILMRLKARGLLEKVGSDDEQTYILTYPQVLRDALKAGKRGETGVKAGRREEESRGSQQADVPAGPDDAGWDGLDEGLGASDVREDRSFSGDGGDPGAGLPDRTPGGVFRRGGPPGAGWRGWGDQENESAANELHNIEQMDRIFNRTLGEILGDRLDDTLAFGERIDAKLVAAYVEGMFGPLLYFDSLLALVHQYAICDVEILSPNNKITNYTGFNLAFFGPPGTGKTFAIDDMIRGNQRVGVPAHGIPGRNRYCGGITPVQFIRMGEAYHDRKFNFVVPEFNDWFKDRGMVEPLKLAMEHREVKYETTRLTVGPYKFSSFFAVNYNVHAFETGYKVTVADPNFNALEDRMLCRLHRWTKKRFRAIDESATNLELGRVHFELARSIREHLTLMHAIETRHPLVKDRFPCKSVMVDEQVYEDFAKANDLILSRISQINFSTRLRSRAIKLACAISLMEYMRGDDEVVHLSDVAKKFALRFYVEEVGTRVGGRFDTGAILRQLGLGGLDEDD